jgi:hypothetical protein
VDTEIGLLDAGAGARPVLDAYLYDVELDPFGLPVGGLAEAYPNFGELAHSPLNRDKEGKFIEEGFGHFMRRKFDFRL